MKLKTKLASLCIAFAMVVGVLMVGVFAVKKTNFTLGGNISFSASGINALISAGTLSDTGVWRNADDASTKMQEVEINTNKTSAQLESEFATWKDINLYFNDAADDVTITFTITNTSDVATEYITVGANAFATESSNATITVSPTSATIAPNDGVQQFTVTMSVTDKETNASLNGFNVEFNLDYAVPEDKTTLESQGYTFVDPTATTAAEATAASSEVKELTISKYQGSATSLTLPALVTDGTTTYAVTTVGANAFEEKTTLETVVFPSTITTIEEWAFSGCSSLTKAELPSNLKKLGTCSFNNCALTSVTIPSSCEEMGDSLFFCCPVENIVIEEGVTTIPYFAFAAMDRLTNVSLPSTIVSIGERAFSDCTSLSQINLPNGLKEIGTYAISATAIKSISIPESVETIGESAFYNNSSLQTVELPTSLKVLPAGMFAYSGIKSIDLSEVEEIGAYAFERCASLNSIVWGNKLKTIGDTAFIDTSISGDIILPDSILSIGNNAFSGVDIGSLTISSNIQNLSSGSIFQACSIETLTFKEGITEIADNLFGNCTINNINLPSTLKKIGNSSFAWISGVSSLTIPEGVTEIGNEAFSNNSSLQIVEFPSTLTSIGNGAFRECALTSIEFPESLTKIGDEAFYGNTSLNTVKIPQNVKSIGDLAFFSGTGTGLMTTVVIDSNDISSVLDTQGSAGYLVYIAETIYIKTGNTVGSYVTENYDSAEGTGEYAGYTVYTKKSA